MWRRSGLALSLAHLSSTPLQSSPATTYSTGPGDECGVFVTLAESVPVPFDQAVAALRLPGSIANEIRVKLEESLC